MKRGPGVAPDPAGMAERDPLAGRSIQKIHIYLRAGDERAGVIGDIDFKKANVSADLDLSLIHISEPTRH